MGLTLTPPAGTHLNYDGPWKLEVTGSLPLAKAEGRYGLEAFDRARQRFDLVLSRPAAEGEKGEYTLTYFFCAEDNSWCKRAQAKGEL